MALYYETLNYFLKEYYNSYDPKSYRRQYDFLRSAVKVEPKIIGNKVVASVYIDTDSIRAWVDKSTETQDRFQLNFWIKQYILYLRKNSQNRRHVPC